MIICKWSNLNFHILLLNLESSTFNINDWISIIFHMFQMKRIYKESFFQIWFSVLIDILIWKKGRTHHNFKFIKEDRRKIYESNEKNEMLIRILRKEWY